MYRYQLLVRQIAKYFLQDVSIVKKSSQSLHQRLLWRSKNFLTKTYLLKRFAIPSLLMAFVPISKSTPENPGTTLKEVLAHADHLYDKLKFDDLYNHLASYKDTQNDEILWRLARAIYEKAREETKKDKRKAAFAEALSYVKTAEKINPNNFAVHKWLVIISDCYYGMEGTKARIQHLQEMKTHMEKACELKPNDGTSWYVLGMWYYGVADISWYERKIASAFFATLPHSTFEDALKIFLKAEKMEPNFYSKNLLMISRCLLNLGQKEEAKMYLKRTAEYSIKTADDQDAVSEATKLLNSI